MRPKITNYDLKRELYRLEQQKELALEQARTASDLAEANRLLAEGYKAQLEEQPEKEEPTTNMLGIVAHQVHHDPTIIREKEYRRLKEKGEPCHVNVWHGKRDKHRHEVFHKGSRKSRR